MVLSDVMMPRMDGFELLRALRADPATADVPVVLLSARAGEESRVDGLDAGADDYLAKPFGARELLARVGAQVERFLAPVEPGNLLLLAYKDEVPIISAPGCFRSAKPNVVDLVMPPLLARYRVSGWEIACLGHGGLLA